jgi:ABC-type Fe3+ transport system permease subunit
VNWPLLQNSLLVAAATTLLAGALGFAAALGLATAGARARVGLVLLGIAALAMPPFLVTNCWLDLLGNNGLLHRWLPANLYSLGGAVLLLTLLLWPLSFFAALIGWGRLQPSQLEVEPALRGVALVRWLLWPLARRSLALAAGLTFVLALNNFAVPTILQVRVFPEEVWVSFNTNLDAWAALQLGWPMAAAPLLLWLALRRGEEDRWPRLENGVEPRLLRRQLGRTLLAASRMTIALLLLLSVGLPLAQLVLSSRTWTGLGPAFAAGSDAVLNSLFFAAGSATLAVGAGLLMQRSSTCSPSRGRSRPAEWNSAIRQSGTLRYAALGALLWLPLLVPGIFLGIALIGALNRPGLDWFYRSVGVVLLALVARYGAPAWFGSRAALQSVDQDLLDAASLDGARGWARFRHVLWPQIGPAVAAVWYAVFLLCLWDVETLILLLPPGHETLASRIFNMLHYGHSAQVNALCVWLLVLAVAPLVLWLGWRRLGRAAFWTTGGWQMAAAAVPVLAVLGLAGCKDRRAAQAGLSGSRLFSRVEIIGRRGVGAGEFNKPRSLAVDTNDNLYVADMTGRVQKFSPDGRYLLSWQMPQTDLGKPKGMCRDRAGNIVVVEPHYQRVNHFAPDGRLVTQWGGHLTNGGPFSLPRAVAINSRHEVVVSEYTLAERVQVFSAGGQKRLLEFGRAGRAPGEFDRPEGLAVDAADRIYVADSCNHRVQVFSPQGRFLRAFGQPGREPGQFSYPYDVQVDGAGRQYVCEFGNSRIQIFAADGQWLETIGGPGAAPGQFANPWSLALDSRGNLYVADSQNHRVQKLVRRPGADGPTGRTAAVGMMRTHLAANDSASPIAWERAGVGALCVRFRSPFPTCGRPRADQAPAVWNSAIQQSGTLRYERGQALLSGSLLSLGPLPFALGAP